MRNKIFKTMYLLFKLQVCLMIFAIIKDNMFLLGTLQLTTIITAIVGWFTRPPGH